MCADSGMLLGLLVFFLAVAASPFVIVAAVVRAVGNYRKDAPLRILD